MPLVRSREPELWDERSTGHGWTSIKQRFDENIQRAIYAVAHNRMYREIAEGGWGGYKGMQKSRVEG